MTRQAYPEYKPSGIEWLGRIPRHWHVKKLKYVASIVTGNTPPKSEPENYSDDGTPWVKPDDLGTLAPITDSKERLSELGMQLARPVPRDSVLVCCIGSVGKLGIAGCVLATNQQINSLVFEDSSVNCRFGQYALITLEQEFVRRANRNVVAILNSQSQGQVPVVIPSPGEQRAIAAFLDRETAEIDALVAKKERLIELLQEKRTALISHAVTKGLNLDVKMKDSGIEWLGEVPEHWELKRLKNLASMRSGENITAESIDVEGEFPVYGGNGIRGFTSRFTHEGEYVLIGRQGALCGNVHRTSNRFWASEHAVVTTCKNDVSPDWLAYLISAMHLKRHSETAAQPGLSVDYVLRLAVPAPIFAEQRAIAAFLGREMIRIECLATRILEGVNRLQEYRIALISAAVIGKIDVRDTGRAFGPIRT